MGAAVREKGNRKIKPPHSIIWWKRIIAKRRNLKSFETQTGEILVNSDTSYHHKMYFTPKRRINQRTRSCNNQPLPRKWTTIMFWKLIGLKKQQTRIFTSHLFYSSSNSSPQIKQKNIIRQNPKLNTLKI